MSQTIPRLEAPGMAWRSTWRAMSLASTLVVYACGDVHYVSLGSNDSAVRVGDADGAGADGPSTASPGADAYATAEPVPTCAEPGSNATAADFTCTRTPDLQPVCEVGLAAVELPAACDTRPVVACPVLGETAALTLNGVLSSVLRECGEFDDVVAVRFEQGCALAFELASDATALAAAASSASIPDAGLSDAGVLDAIAPERADVRRCVGERLAAQRYECARDIACRLGSSFPIPTR